MQPNSQNHQGLGGMEQERKIERKTQTIPSITHIAPAQTASPRKLPQAPRQATTKTASE